MQKYFKAAIENIFQHGDTDVLPFPIDNRIIYDKMDVVIERLQTIYNDFDTFFTASPPTDIRSMTPVSHTGFRWGTQLDPLWNAYLLGVVISCSDKIEGARLDTDYVYSYRLDFDSYLKGKLFRTDVTWRHFMKSTYEQCDDDTYLIICDISDCYSRISHHKLQNYLQMIGVTRNAMISILEYLKFLSGTRSTGLPVGGPASRILSELSLNAVDTILHDRGVRFLRYADDYHIINESRQKAYENLYLLSSSLDNEGLSLQKSKTRIVSKPEYFSIIESLLALDDTPRTPIQRLMTLNLRYDPYAPDAVEKYEELRKRLDDIDIIGLLNDQLNRTQIHIASARKIISAVSAIDKELQYGAILSMLDNMRSLFPIAAVVFQTILSVFENLTEEQKDGVCEKIRKLYSDGHEVMGIASFVAYSVRIIGKKKSTNNQQWLVQCFERESSALVRRDIVLVFSNWKNFPWLSMFRKAFETANVWERRAFIIASYSMGDEGMHWRQHSKDRFSWYEKLVRDWRSEKADTEISF